MEIDLSAIAKGFAVDEIARLLDEHNLSGYLVEIGGEVRSQGTRSNGTPWRVGLEKPSAAELSVQRILPFTNKALATSGDYRNFFEIDGQRYSHTIDPRTGRPVVDSLASVTIAADECMQADAWATTLMVLGSQRGYNLAVDHNIAALLIVRDESEFIETTTPRWDTLFADTEDADDRESHMKLFLAVIVVFGVAFVGMAVGVIFSNRRLRGTCSGLAGMRDAQGNTLCESCDHPSEICTGVKQPEPSANKT